MIDPDTLAQNVRDVFNTSIATKKGFVAGDCPEALVSIAMACAEALRGGNKLMFCGNGGSAADAQHLAAECVVRLRATHDRRALPAISLAMDLSTITACGNDYGFEDIFCRPLEALGQPGDVLVGITTSGKSPNILKAMTRARELKITTTAFLGCGGGPALALSDHALVVPSSDTGSIQESHITAGHALIQLIEDILIDAGALHYNGPAND